MPIEDIEVRRAYQRIWIQRKKQGLATKNIRQYLPQELRDRWPAKIETPMTLEERKQKRREKSRVATKNKREKGRQLRLAYLGSKCHLCKRVSRGVGIIGHRKDGNAHEDFRMIGLTRLEAELKTGRYIGLCYSCHKGVHWCMKYLGMTWEEIEKGVSSSGKMRGLHP